MSRAVMQKALEALEWNYNNDLDNIPACEQWAKMLNETITALKQALAEPQTTHWEGCEAVHPECRKPEQEPIGHADLGINNIYIFNELEPRAVPAGRTPLYTAPTPRKPLTDEEIERACVPLGAAMLSFTEVARAIERAHGIGEQT